VNGSAASAYFQELYRLLKEMAVTAGRVEALSLEDGVDRALGILKTIKASSNKVMLIGNGGSAGIVSHMQNDLCKAVGVRAMVFNEQPLLTALSNDCGYEAVFEMPVKLWASQGDLLLAVSSSGRSENILRAVRAAVSEECRVITLSGFDDDNPLRTMGDLNFHVASPMYGFVEVAHTALAHYLTDRASGALSGR
jgi:D-sedoheptulose 7-phosphate isomerase